MASPQGPSLSFLPFFGCSLIVFLHHHLWLPIFDFHLLSWPCAEKPRQQVALSKTKFAAAGFKFPMQQSPSAAFWGKCISIVFLGFYSFHLQCTPGLFRGEGQSFSDLHYSLMVGSSKPVMSRVQFIHLWIIQLGENKGVKVGFMSKFLWFPPSWHSFWKLSKLYLCVADWGR